MLDYRIQTFLTVCQTMNYTRASEVLHITQPAVSQHIRYLEQYYHTQLFQLEGKHLVLTPQGDYLYRTMSTVSHDELIVKDKIQTLNRESQNIRIGATMTIGEFDLKDKIITYLKMHPELSFRFHIADTRILLEELDAGTIDIAVVEGNFDRNKYDYKVYKNESFLPVCAPGYFTSTNSIRLEELLDVPLLIREEGSGTREIFEHYLHEYNLSVSDFKNKIEINNMNIIREAVKAGCGITFLYEPVVHLELLTGTLAIIPIEGYDIAHDFTFLWSKGSIHKQWYLEIYNDLNA